MKKPHVTGTLWFGDGRGTVYELVNRQVNKQFRINKQVM